MEKKKDLRVIKTKKMIYTALVELMKEKTFEEIKVSDICEKALINRSTFYAHYEDKYELLIDFIKDLKEEFSQKLENNKALNIKEYYLELIKIFLNHVEDKKDIYSSIMIHNRNSIMMDILLSAINNDILKRISKEKFSDGIPAEIIAKFYVGGVLNLGFEYLNSNGKYSKEDIISYIDKLIKEEK